jgi:hypothetical protein
MKIWKCLVVMLLGLFLLAPNVFAAPIPLGYEDSGNGFIGDLPNVAILSGAITITVASDGEAYFDPYGYGNDTTDGIQFPAGLAVQCTSQVWVQTVPNTWVLPAVNENEPSYETAGVFNLGVPFAAGLGTYLIFEDPNYQTISDTIIVSNNGPGGVGQIVFQSDPVPLPGAVWLLGSGLLGLAGLRRRFGR